MARQQQVTYTLTCDICGDEISGCDSEGASRTLSWEGAQYTVDLCATHQGELDKSLHQLNEFVDAAKPIAAARRGRGAARSSTKTPKDPGAVSPRSTAGSGRRGDIPAIRVWARENGYQVGDRARIAAGIMAAYDQAHGRV